MEKKYIRTGIIALGVLAILFMIANFGANFWLKNNLPNYIKKNSDYKIAYKTLDVDLGTGNIFATGVIVNSKNPQNKNVIGLDGTIDTLKISRLGIYDALFRKRINSSDLMMAKPNLKITLAKPIDDKTGKKRNPVVFENIRIRDGNILINRHTQQKYFSVQNLNLFVENLQMTEESVESKLPVVFDKYDIAGKNFFFRPDNIYAIKADVVTTKNGLMNIRNFKLVPLLSFAQFSRYYPQKGKLFDLKASEMDFKDIVLKNNKVSLSNVRFENPDLKMYSSPKTTAKQKDFKYEINLDDVAMNNAKVQILKPNGNKIFTAGNLNLDVRKFKLDEQTAKGNIPFAYDKFLIKGKNINYISETQDVKVASLALNQTSGDLRSILVKPTNINPQKASLNLISDRIRFTVDNWKLENDKLKLNAKTLLIDGLNGTIAAAKNPIQQKPNYNGIDFPLTVKNVSLKNSNLVFDNGTKPLVFKDLYANIEGLEMNEKTVKDAIPFKTGNYTLTTRNFSYRPNQFYQMNVGLLKFNKNVLQINNFSMKPLVSRAQFIRMIPAEKDLYDLKANSVTMNGTWDLVSEQKFMNLSTVLINGVNANIFRSKIPKDDLSEKPLYSKLLRSVKFPLFIENLDIKNSLLEYEEDTKKSDGPGKLTFGNFNMNVKNLNSAKMSGKPTQVPITINCLFMNTSPMKVNWNFNTADQSDAFSISGNIADLPAERINPFIEPYLKIQATGLISDLIFNFKGNKAGLNGALNMKHRDLKVAVLKPTGEKNKLLSAIANIFVKTDSGSYPESVVVDVERDPTKSFFNLFWRGIEDGLKKTLIGKNANKTEASVKNTVENTKAALKTNKEQLKEVKENVKSALKKKDVEKTEPKQVEPPKKQGLLNKIFKKKEKAEN